MTTVTEATAVAEPEPREHNGWQTFLLGGSAACLAWLLSQIGMKFAFAGIVAVIFVCTLMLVRDRERVTLFLGVLSMVAIMHKSFSGIEHVSSGPPSIYINSVDVMVLLLYAFWFSTGTLVTDLREQLRRPVVWLPIVAVLFMLPSLLVASSTALSFAEILRMIFEWLVFVYLAARVRRRSDVHLVLSALAVIVVVEFLVVLGQWKTNSSLGMSFFGTPVDLGQRITNTSVLGRPFGTIIHPVFMGAFLGPLALLGLCLAINLRVRRQRIAALTLAVMATAPIVIAHARSAALGLAVAVVLVLAVSLWSRRLEPRVFAGAIFAVVIGCTIFMGKLLALYHDNFHTAHFSVEVDARGQLYSLGWRMFDAHPLFGTGLNNFQQVMEPYNHLGLIFDGNPVHNLFLLQAAETGLVGFIALLLAGLPVLVVALRVARSRDRLYGAIGMAVAAMFAFFIVEEMFVFSLRQDHPRTLFWMLSGLVVACSRLMTQPEEQDETAQAGGRTPGGASVGAVRRPVSRPRTVVKVAKPARWRTAWSRLAWGRMALGRIARLAVHGLHAAAVRAAAAARIVGPPAGRGLRRSGRFAAQALPSFGVTRVLTVVLAVGFVVVPKPGTADDAPPPVTKIVFSAQDRSTTDPGALAQASGIYIANSDGSDVHEIVGHNGMDYSWSKWALNGTKIVFSAHHFGSAQPDQLFIMDADGSNQKQLTSTGWINGQPSVSPDGRYMLFASTWPEYPRFAIYRMDLRTLMVTNLSALATTGQAADGDPRYSTDGQHIAFANSQLPGTTRIVPTQIWIMGSDGRHRTQVTHDRYYNTDPELSPDGHDVVYSSYRGPGRAADGNPGQLQVKLFDWFIVVHNRRTGAERSLNQGLKCAERPDNDPCGPTDGAAYVPQWSPDGHNIAYTSILSTTTSCLCVMGADGSNAHALITTTRKIQFYDWQTMGAAPATAVQIGSAVPQSQLLFVGKTVDGAEAIFKSRPDRWGSTAIGLPPFLSGVSNPRWSADRKHIIFSAEAPIRKVPAPPDAPPGHHRIRHYTLGWLTALMMPHGDRTDIDRTQTYEMDPDGTNVKELTTGSTEDWHDAIPDGEWRGNSQGDISPDGRYAVVTNLSSTSSESFLLRINLSTGSVYNLTNATAGAVATTDFNPRYSPNGKKIVFSTIVGGNGQIALIDSRTGRAYRQLTNDNYYNVSPTWSPDGRYIVYSSFRGKGSINTDPDKVANGEIPGHVNTNGWYLVRIDTRTGHKTVLTPAGASPTFSPVFSPDGSQIAYIGFEHSPAQPDIFVMPSAGGRPQPLQVTLVTKEASLDWR